MSKKQSYGKTKLSDEHKMQIAQIGASILAVAVSAGALAACKVNPLVIAGITGAITKTVGDIYKFWKTKPDNDLCKKLDSQIEEIAIPDPEVINHDTIAGILSAAADIIQEKTEKNTLIAYREDADALFQDIWHEMGHKYENAPEVMRYCKEVSAVISSNIQISDIEMQSYLLAMPTDILEGVKSLLEELNREQTETITQAQEEANQKQTADIKQFIIDILNQRDSLSDKKKAFPKADNQDYLDHFYAPLFLEKRKSKVTLASMYVPPHIKDKQISASKCIMEWFKDKDIEPCLLLYGNAGVGKSSLVSKIIADANQKTCAEKEFELTADQVLAVALRNHCNKIDMSQKADEILGVLFDGYEPDELQRKLLILDGLDEVCVLKHDFNGHTFLEKMAKLKTGFHVLVTSREAKDYFDDPKNIDDLQIVHLQWEADEIETWCKKYCGAIELKKVWCDQFIQGFNALDKNDLRRDIFCVPIILYICGNSEISLADHNSVGSIYDDAFRKILLRKHLRGHGDYTNLTKADVQSNLIAWQYTKELAYQMFLLDTLDLAESGDPNNMHTKGLINARIRTKGILKEKHGIDVPDNALDIKKELALCPFTKANGITGITFAHKTVYEYFTAVKLYEDYFAKFNSSYFSNKDKDEASEEAMETAIDAFRYKAIDKEIFEHLCVMNDAPFSGTGSNSPDGGLDFPHYEQAYIQAMEARILDTIAVKAPVKEYLYPELSDENQINAQVIRAFRALTFFLSGHGFRNKNGSNASKRFKNFLVLSEQKINIIGWNLDKASLCRANLYNEDLHDVHLKGADLEEADLTSADLEKADLSSVNMRYAHLSFARFKHSDLTSADLRGSNLRGASLFSTDLRKANLQGANLQSADLQDADLQDAKLQDAKLQGAKLQGAKLQGAKLQRTDLRGTDLRGADLRGADLQKTRLHLVDLTGAKYCTHPDAFTVFPDGFDPKEHGMIEVDE